MSGAKTASATLGTHPCLAQHGDCKFGHRCKYARYPADTCLHYLRGKCKYAASCTRKHPNRLTALNGDRLGATRRAHPCVVQFDACKYGDRCKFVVERGDACLHHLANPIDGCKLGSGCLLYHKPQDVQGVTLAVSSISQPVQLVVGSPTNITNDADTTTQLEIITHVAKEFARVNRMTCTLENPTIRESPVSLRFQAGLEHAGYHSIRELLQDTNSYEIGFHGTRDTAAVAGILHEGFDPSKRGANGQVYGPGEYFDIGRGGLAAQYSATTQCAIVALLIKQQKDGTPLAEYSARAYKDRPDHPIAIVNNPEFRSGITFALPVLAAACSEIPAAVYRAIVSKVSDSKYLTLPLLRGASAGRVSAMEDRRAVPVQAIKRVSVFVGQGGNRNSAVPTCTNATDGSTLLQETADTGSVLDWLELPADITAKIAASGGQLTEKVKLPGVTQAFTYTWLVQKRFQINRDTDMVRPLQLHY